VDVDLLESVDEAIEVLAPVATVRNVGLRPVFADDVKVVADQSALGRVLRNVIENGIRHAPSESEVTIGVDVADGFVTVRVTDLGPGFSDDFVDVAFDRFTRADPARGRGPGGSGLGLAIASGFINAMQGEIWAEPGPGGCVGFRLPTASVSRRASSGLARSDSQLAGSRDVHH
ncbi:MAG: sensor histidine kinase, partial [Acidimicrobiia bacterium]